MKYEVMNYYPSADYGWNPELLLFNIRPSPHQLTAYTPYEDVKKKKVGNYYYISSCLSYASPAAFVGRPKKIDGVWGKGRKQKH